MEIKESAGLVLPRAWRASLLQALLAPGGLPAIFAAPGCLHCHVLFSLCLCTWSLLSACFCASFPVLEGLRRDLILWRYGPAGFPRSSFLTGRSSPSDPPW